MAALPKTEAPAYTDFAALGKLRRGAGNNDPAAIRAVAEQFEALLTRTMLKSMRDAIGPDPMFGSDQQQMYQGMADDQLSVQLSKGKGLGLANMLVRQLQKLGVKGADAAEGSTTPHAAAKATAAYTTTQRASDISTASSASDPVKSTFIQDMWPHAQEAGQLLGVDPRHLIAQAALETNWGRNMPQDPAGRCSNNLFGIKSSGDWTGASVTSATHEFLGGSQTATPAQFRAYATAAQSFQDYASLLRNSPRFAAALNTGADVHAFAAGLQRGGYATDPNYASKIAAVANKVNETLAVGTLSQSGAGMAGGFKLAGATPISAGTGTL